jgi:hypothetical protein
MIVSDGAGFDYLMGMVLDGVLDFVEFLRSFQYGLYVIIFTS